jgi:hypothetical protein
MDRLPTAFRQADDPASGMSTFHDGQGSVAAVVQDVTLEA